ncbi:MAG: HEAT repeat domain-containing protein [Deltaproteobacteria bacterium]|nr:HEAT repeat domain-containing protein [Deltaproteobacteria bacterium]
MKTKSLNFCDVLLCVFFISIAGCYQPEDVADTPPDLIARQQNFEVVAASLREIGTADEKAAVSNLSSNDKRIRRAAALRMMTLGNITPSAVNTLVSILQNDPEARVRSAAVRALGEVSGNPTGVSAIVRAMCDENPNVRLYATKSLLHLDTKANAAILDFMAASNDTGKHCPSQADPSHTLQKELLYQLGVQGARFLSLYVEGLSHPQTDVVRLCLSQIRKSGRSASSALPAMVDLMHSPDDQIRFDTIQTFALVGDQYPLVMPVLFQAAESDPAPKVRNAAANAIKQIQEQHAKANTATTKSPEVKRSRKAPPQPRQK